ncbi:unnamed protein product [Trifolium pratense]|uniref:Uncharacterized protein n=1 Tax=Trifolium pratense TaxID=57577 RepID=A0ACB0JZ91_TRIPR|nr:unnamed protein product [Trifolium pratense]
MQQQLSVCVLCELTAETGPHLFLHCNCTSKVWHQSNAVVRDGNNSSTKSVYVFWVVNRQWFIDGTAKDPCLLYEWRWSPFDCFYR